MQNMKSIGFSQYCITRDGRVYSLKINRWITQQISNNGYYVVSMGADNGTRYRKKVHRLLLQIFKPIDNPEDMVVNHKDANKLNNNLDNLEWTTLKENSSHAVENGLYKPNLVNEHTKFPEDHEILYTSDDDMINNRKYIDDEMLHNIFQKMQDGYRKCDISKMIGVTARTINAIVNNPSKSITEIMSGYDISKVSRLERTNVETVIKICELLSTGKSATRVAKDLNIHERIVMNIKARKNFLTISCSYSW